MYEVTRACGWALGTGEPQARIGNKYPGEPAPCTGWIRPSALPASCPDGRTDGGSEKMGPVAFVTLCLLGCLVCSPALAGTQAGFCPEGWKSHQGDCYGYFPQRRTWQEAQAECQEQGAGTHLVSILSAGENNMVAKYVRQNPGSGSVWIGLSDPSETQCWGWADRSPAKFTVWGTGQPDGQSQNERCVVLKVPDFQEWHDYPCNETFRFVCKRGSCGRQLLPAPGQ